MPQHKAPAPAARTRAVEELTEQQCWDALASVDVGRIAIRAGNDIDIFPVNFLVHDKRVYFRSAPGAKLIDLTRSPRVAFEADGSAGEHGTGPRWSVVIKGGAHRLGMDSEIVASGVLTLHSLVPTEKWNYVAVVPHTISGRRFEPAP